MVGNSDNGGAGYVNNDHRGDQWNNRAFRLSVVSVQWLYAERFFPPANHFTYFNKIRGPGKIIGFFNKFLFRA